jgi:hypothetical protein
MTKIEMVTYEKMPRAESQASRFLVDANLSQQTEITQHFARSQHNRCQRIIRNGYRQSGLLANPFV